MQAPIPGAGSIVRMAHAEPLISSTPGQWSVSVRGAPGDWLAREGATQLDVMSLLGPTTRNN